MRNHSGGKNLIYVHMNYTHKYVLSYGIEFPEFMDSIPFKPANLLLLKHKFEDGYFNMHTLLHYASEEGIQQLMNDHVDRYGDFCWIDFTDEDDLNEMESQSLAELLYLSHMKAPLRPPFYRILGNQYAYLTQEDGFFNRTYYKHWEHFYGMLGGVLSTKISPKRERSFFGRLRSRSIPPVPLEVLQVYTDFMCEGLAFSLEKVTVDRQRAVIPIWVIGDFQDMDEMVEEFEVRSRRAPAGRLVLDRRNSEWQAIIY